MFYDAWWEQSRCLSVPGPHAPFCGGLGRSLHAEAGWLTMTCKVTRQAQRTHTPSHSLSFSLCVSSCLGRTAAAAAVTATGETKRSEANEREGGCGVKMDR